jgi:hypothetical protein
VQASGDWPLQVRVTRGVAVDEITIYAPSGPAGIRRGDDRDVGVAVRTLVEGKPVRQAQFGRISAQAPGVRRGKIVAVDRTTNSVTLDAPLPSGTRWVRLYSAGRSSMYAVISARRQGQRTVVNLKESSLLARGLPVGYRPGVIENDAPIPFATFPVSEKDEQPVYHDRFAGARVETADGKLSHRLRGVDGRQWITGISDYDLYLEQPLPAAQLERAFGTPGSAVRFAVYDYGLGDRWEALVTTAP